DMGGRPHSRGSGLAIGIGAAAESPVASADALDRPRRARPVLEPLGRAAPGRRRDPGRWPVRAPRRPRPEAGGRLRRPRSGTRRPAVVEAPVHHRHVGLGDPGGRRGRRRDPADAAAREVREETGWRPGPVEHLVTYQPSNGLSDQRFNIFLARGAEHEGDPVDFGEAERIAWRSVDDVRADIAGNGVADGLSLTALLYALPSDRLGPSR